MVHLKGLEPSRRGHQILSLARLPIPPQVHYRNSQYYSTITTYLSIVLRRKYFEPCGKFMLKFMFETMLRNEEVRPIADAITNIE